MWSLHRYIGWLFFIIVIDWNRLPLLPIIETCYWSCHRNFWPVGFAVLTDGDGRWYVVWLGCVIMWQLNLGCHPIVMVLYEIVNFHLVLCVLNERVGWGLIQRKVLHLNFLCMRVILWLELVLQETSRHLSSHWLKDKLSCNVGHFWWNGFIGD